jgi:hypothetical protein
MSPKFFRAPEDRNGRLDAAATPPAEASSVSGATPSAWKDEIVVLVRSVVWLARGGRWIAGAALESGQELGEPIHVAP